MQNRQRQARHRARGKAVGKTASAAKKERQEVYLTALAEPTRTQKDAEAAAGITAGTVDQWEHRDPEFKRRRQRILGMRRGTYQAPKVAFDAAFRKRYFHRDTPPHMAQLIQVINEQVEIAEREQRRDRRVLILLPPEHGKSTVAVEEYLCYRLSQDETFRGTIVCATQGKARKRNGAIERMLTDRTAYEDLIDTFGPFRSEARLDSKPWTADYFMHLRAPADQRDYSCQALGWTGDIYGDRMDLIVYDDVATLKNQTPAEIEKQWEKTWGECRSRIRKGGLFLVIGTRMREGDIYSVMEEKGFFTDKVIMPAIVREPGTLGDEDPGEALWEAGTSLDELLQLRTDDERMFELMYQQNPLPSVGAVFPHDAIQSCFNPMRSIGDIPEGCFTVAGIDPSVNNFTAGVVIALRRTESGEWMRYLVDVWNERNLTGEGGDNHIGVVDFIVELCRTYHVSTLCVEDGAWMSLINNAFTLRSRLFELGVRHIPVKASEQTVGAEAIRQLSGLFTMRLLDLPGTPAAKQHLNAFTNQLLTWTDHKQHWRKAFDIVKAFRQAEHAVRWATRKGATPAHHVIGEGGDAPSMLEKVAVNG